MVDSGVCGGSDEMWGFLASFGMSNLLIEWGHAWGDQEVAEFADQVDGAGGKNEAARRSNGLGLGEGRRGGGGRRWAGMSSRWA